MKFLRNSFHIFARLISGLFLLLLITGCVDGSEAERTSADTADPFELNMAMQKGINMGNALEAPAEGQWGMVIRSEFFDLIRDAGFDAVRIPIRWNAHAENTPPYAVEPDFLGRIDEVIGWAKERDLVVMINLHHYNELMDNPGQHRERFLSIWKQVAERYRDYPNTLLFEVLNEPHNNLDPGLWNGYLRDAINIIRESNPDRTLVIGTAPWGGFGGLQDLIIPENDRNIIVTVHYYNPFQFTHQGASWAGDQADEWLGTTWTGTEEEKKDVDDDFDMVLDWAEEYNRPIHLGEFGAYEAAPMESRILWTEYVRQAAEQRGFSWAYWEFGAGFGIYNREQGV